MKTTLFISFSALSSLTSTLIVAKREMLATSTANISSLSALPVEYALPLSTQTNDDIRTAEDEQSNFAVTIPHPVNKHHLLLARLSNNYNTLILSTIPPTAPALSINLHSAAIPSAGLFYDDEASSVHILLVTQSGALLRLAVPLFVLNSPSKENLPDGWATEYVLNCTDAENSQISTVEPVDICTILLGMVDGSLVLCEQPRGNRTLLGKGLVSYYESALSSYPYGPC